MAHCLNYSQMDRLAGREVDYVYVFDASKFASRCSCSLFKGLSFPYQWGVVYYAALYSFGSHLIDLASPRHLQWKEGFERIYKQGLPALH